MLAMTRYIWQHTPEATRDRCYFYNSFFYKKLSEKQPGLPAVTTTGRCEAAKAAHERVRKWTKVSAALHSSQKQAPSGHTRQPSLTS